MKVRNTFLFRGEPAGISIRLNGNYQITFHLTQEEAKNNENPQPTTYTTNQTTTIWVRVEDQQGCFVVRELNLESSILYLQFLLRRLLVYARETVLFFKQKQKL